MTQTFAPGPAADRLAEARRSRSHGLTAAAVTTYALAAELAVDAAAAHALLRPIDPGADVHAQRQDRARRLAATQAVPAELPDVLADLHRRVLALQQAGTTPSMTDAEFSRVDATIATALTMPAATPPPQTQTHYVQPAPSPAYQQPVVIQQRSSAIARVAGTGCAVAIGVAIALLIAGILAFRAAKNTVEGVLDDAIELVNPDTITGPGTVTVNEPATFKLPTANDTPKPTVSAVLGDVRLQETGQIAVVRDDSDDWQVQLAAGPSARVRRSSSSAVFPRKLKDGDRITITVRQDGNTLASKTVTVNLSS